jgi:hypothetical protein
VHALSIRNCFSHPAEQIGGAARFWCSFAARFACAAPDDGYNPVCVPDPHTPDRNH